MSVKSCQNAGLDRYALDLKTDPEDIYALYKSDPQYLTFFLARLFELKGYDSIMKILDTEKERLLDSTEVYQHVSDMLLEEAPALREASALKSLITFFMGLIPLVKCPFQIYLLCRTVSALVVHNGRFASKAQAIRYFRYVSLILRRSGSLYNYLNCLNLLDSLEAVAISEREYLFLKDCVSIRKERFCKELFCGAKPVDVDEIFKNRDFQPGDFTEMPNWKRLIEIRRDGKEIPPDIGFLSFLKKNSIAFERLANGNVSVGGYEEPGHTTRLFQIARMYEVGGAAPTSAPEPVEGIGKVGEETLQEEDELQPSPTAADAVHVETAEPKSEFVDRFRAPHKRFKWFYKQTTNVFNDTCLDKRNSNRQEAFRRSNEEYEHRRQALLQREDLVSGLLPMLDAKVAEHRALEHRKLLEKQRLEEERALDERRNKMWKYRGSESPAADQYKPPIFDSGPYRSPFSGTASDSSNASYVPPHLMGQHENKPDDH